MGVSPLSSLRTSQRLLAASKEVSEFVFYPERELCYLFHGSNRRACVNYHIYDIFDVLHTFSPPFDVYIIAATPQSVKYFLNFAPLGCFLFSILVVVIWQVMNQLEACICALD